MSAGICHAQSSSNRTVVSDRCTRDELDGIAHLMETRRTKRKEVAASDSNPPEPRNKKARRATADTKAKTGANRKAKQPAATSGATADLQPPAASEPADRNSTLDSAPAVAASVAAESSRAKPEDTALARRDISALEKRLASHKAASEAQDRASMEQVLCTRYQ